MFCYFDINDLSNVTVKCDPDSIPELEEHYDWISKPYNGNAKYWIGMDAYRADNEQFAQKELILLSWPIQCLVLFRFSIFNVSSNSLRSS